MSDLLIAGWWSACCHPLPLEQNASILALRSTSYRTRFAQVASPRSILVISAALSGGDTRPRAEVPRLAHPRINRHPLPSPPPVQRLAQRAPHTALALCLVLGAQC